MNKEEDIQKFKEIKKKFVDIIKEDNDEDDDENFIKKDAEYLEELEMKKKNILQDIQNSIGKAIKKIQKAKDGVRPEGNQQRNLDRETGGLEAENASKKHSEDSWDKRPEEIAKMIEDEQALNNAAKSSRAQGFIHVMKQKKRAEKDHAKAADALGLAGGFVAGLNLARSKAKGKTSGGASRE